MQSERATPALSAPLNRALKDDTNRDKIDRDLEPKVGRRGFGFGNYSGFDTTLYLTCT